MNCPDFETLMMFLDGELREEMLHQVSEHARTCGRCRKLIESQRKLESSWRDDFVYPERDQFRRVEDELFRRMNRRRRWKVLLPAAAGIIAALLGVKLILHDGPALDRVSAVARSRVEESVLPAPGVREAVEEPALLPDSSAFGQDDQLETPEAAGEDVAQDVPDATGRSYGLTGSASDEEVVEEAEEMRGDAPEGTPGFQEEDLNEPGYGETPEEQVQLDGMSGGVSGMEVQDTVDITLSLDSDTTGLGTVSTLTTRQNSGSESVPESSCWLEEEMAAEPFLRLVFDDQGIPDSATSLLLDSLLPDWRDYIHDEFRDTVLVVPLDGLHDLLNDGSVLPEQATE